MPSVTGRQTRQDAEPSGAAVTAPPTVRPSTSLGRTRRRPALIALGLALTCLGGLAAAWLATSATTATPVVVAAKRIEAGQVLKSSDLGTATLSKDPSVASVPGAELSDLVGQRATAALLPGQVVPPAAVAEALTPAAGYAMVGLAMTADRMPAEPLRSGDAIQVVITPNPQDDPPRTNPPSTPATVVSTHAVADTDTIVVDVTVRSTAAPLLAAQAATGRIAIVLLPPPGR